MLQQWTNKKKEEDSANSTEIQQDHQSQGVLQGSYRQPELPLKLLSVTETILSRQLVSKTRLNFARVTVPQLALVCS